MKPLKIICTILIFLGISVSVISQQQWTAVSSPTSNDLWNVYFCDTLNGWIGGDTGVIIRTSNGGNNWYLQNSGVQNFIKSVFFLNKDTGYALSWEFDKNPPNYYGTRILSTTNGGNNWSNYLFRDTNLFLNTIYFTDSQNGFMGGSEGKLYYTSNSGTDWIRATVDSALVSGFPVEKISFVNGTTGFAAGGAFDIAGMIWKTTNRGRNWRADIVGPEPLNDIYVINSNEVLCVGGDYEYGASRITTTNGGINWNYLEIGVFGICRSVDYRTSSEAWIALGIVDSFLVTTNNGSSWILRPSPDGAQLFSLTFSNERNGWAVGKNGKILKFNPFITDITDLKAENPETLILHQNYPNPFNPVTRITYELKESKFITLSIFDILGNEITTPVDEKQNAGVYNLEFDGSNLSSGIYLVKISAGESKNSVYKATVKSAKMLLIK